MKTEVAKYFLNIEALKAGDRAEFVRLIDLYSGKIFNLLNRMLNNEQDAEDTLQGTFVKTFRSLRNFEERSHISTWMYRIAVNEALMMMRKNRGGVISIDDTDGYNEDMSGSHQLVDWRWLPEQELLSTETNKLLEKSIQSLSPTLKAVFILRDIEGLSIRETAEVMDISEENVKVRLFRARIRLRDMLTEYFNERYQRKQVRS